MLRSTWIRLPDSAHHSSSRSSMCSKWFRIVVGLSGDESLTLMLSLRALRFLANLPPCPQSNLETLAVLTTKFCSSRGFAQKVGGEFYTWWFRPEQNTTFCSRL
jgi:hypothetical protein